MGFENELRQRRHAIETEIGELRAQAESLEVVLGSYDAVLAHCDPNAPPICALPKAKGPAPLRLPSELQRLNKTEAAFEVLSEAGRSTSTAECVSAIATRQGIAADHPGLRRFSSHVSATLSSLLRRERARQSHAPGGQTLLWEVAV